MTALEELFADLSTHSESDVPLVSSKSVVPSVPLGGSMITQEPKVSVEEKRERRIKSIESSLLEESMVVVRDSLKAFELPEGDEPPQECVDDIGYEAALVRLRTARAALLSKKEAPVAFDMAKTISMAIIRARAAEKTGPRVLNVQMVRIEAAGLPQFAEIDLTEEV